jgi:hypothetical protein
MADTYPSILHIENAALSNLGNLQIGIMAGNDADLGFRMWGGKDGAGSVTHWLAKDEDARVQSMYILDLDVLDSAGIVKYDSDGLLAGAGALDNLADVTITTPTTDQALVYDGAKWVNGTVGYVIGPSSSTDDALVTWDGTTGELVQNSVVRFQNITDHHLIQMLDTAADTTWIDVIQVENVPPNGSPGGQTVVVGDPDYDLLIRADSDPYLYDGSTTGKVIHENVSTGWSIVSSGGIEITGADTASIFSLETTGTNGGAVELYVGNRTPLSNVSAAPGSMYYREGGTSSRVYNHRGAATNNTGWVELGVAAEYGTLDDSYDYDSGERLITLDDGAVNWNITGNHDFNITLTSLTPTGSIGLKVVDSSYYFHVVKSTSYTYLDTNLGEFDLTGAAESQIVVTGASADLILGARGETIDLSDADNTTLSDGFTETSILGAINEARYPAGVNFALRTTPADNDWYAVCYGNGLFVSVASSGTSNRVMTSPDAINWSLRTSAGDLNWRGVTYGNGLFVAIAISGTGTRVMTSPDAINWSLRTSAGDLNWRGVTYGKGLFVAVANSGTGQRVMTSPDGRNWSLRTSAADENWRAITYGNGIFVAVAITGTGTRAMTSPDGITWTLRTTPESDWQSVCYGEGLFVAVASAGTNLVMTSPDGITWTARSAPSEPWQSVCYGDGLFVAIENTQGSGNLTMTSPDGINWTSHANAASSSNWRAVCYGNGSFVSVNASSTGNRVMSSGEQNNYIPPSNNIYQGDTEFTGDVTFDSQLYLGVSDNACLTWETNQTNPAMYIGTDSTSRTIIIGEKADVSFDRALTNQSNPTLAICSANQSTTEYVADTHDQTDAARSIGKGGQTIISKVPIVLASDATFKLPVGSVGWGIFTVGGDSGGSVGTAFIHWDDTGTAFKISENITQASSETFEVIDTAGAFCFFTDGAAAVTVKNRLAVSVSVVFTYQYTTNPTGEFNTE